MSGYKLFIDECLSPELVQLAIEAGHLDATCVSHRGLRGAKDWELMSYIAAQDLTLVTHNSRDFRGAGAAKPGGLHAAQEIHAGLICLNSAIAMDFDRQIELFSYALAGLANLPDLINQVLEVSETAEGEVQVCLYDLPA